LTSTALVFFTGEEGGPSVAWTIESIADNAWHHLAIIRDDDNDQVTLHIDGTSKGTHAATLNALTIDSGGLMFGQEQDSVGGGLDPAQALDGTLDDIRIYSRVLVDAEIAALADAGSEPDNDSDGIPDDVDPDDDNDGIPDVWETAKGLDPMNASDAGLDPDHDGFSSLEEYVADTHPLDGDSMFQVSSLGQACGGQAGFIVGFDSAVGRLYAVEYRDDLLAGTWQSLTNNVPGTGAEICIQDDDAVQNRFYRIKARMQ